MREIKVVSLPRKNADQSMAHYIRAFDPFQVLLCFVGTWQRNQD